MVSETDEVNSVSAHTQVGRKKPIRKKSISTGASLLQSKEIGQCATETGQRPLCMTSSTGREQQGRPVYVRGQWDGMWASRAEAANVFYFLSVVVANLGCRNHLAEASHVCWALS